MDKDGVPCRLEILDTAGTEQFTPLRQLYFNKGHGYLLVYSINSQSSFFELESIRNDIISAKQSEDFPLVLVGNKSDLTNERTVSTAEGKSLAKRFNNCRFFESSAKTKTNIDEIFDSLIDVIWEKTGKPAGDSRKTPRNSGCVLL
eukprot:TRINITY_DN1905_c0_g1_i2.p1 TRINITY_DN1905_c0_g1~~TRINITY_DN1905_c0_g1_i2.p1  ORF type:complete len:146 (-),score=29.44 TRINITY_DN1905_c0_g1_i2:259-696(-)